MAVRALANDLFLRALRREPTPRTPVWIMRQAGRYLPEYRATRAAAGSFVNLMKNPARCCEVTLQPLARFPLDAAILFSDILTIPDAMGLGLSFAEGEGPRLAQPLRDGAAIASVEVPDVKRELDYVFEAVERIRAALGNTLPLIGFAGSPWTLLTYIVEGGSSREFKHAKSLLWREPDSAERLLDVLSAAVTAYLIAQIDAGCNAVMLFDSWGGALAQHQYLEFSLKPMTRIVRALQDQRPHVPVIVFSKGAHASLEAIADSGADALGLDWTLSLGAARARVGERCALQGNLDPAVLLAPIDTIEREVARTLESFGHGPGHVFNLGHGITPDVPPEHLGALVDAVHRLSPALKRD
jgi:uroporphyrinogen decarboxylase